MIAIPTANALQLVEADYELWYGNQSIPYLSIYCTLLKMYEQFPIQEVNIAMNLCNSEWSHQNQPGSLRFSLQIGIQSQRDTN